MELRKFTKVVLPPKKNMAAITPNVTRVPTILVMSLFLSLVVVLVVFLAISRELYHSSVE